MLNMYPKFFQLIFILCVFSFHFILQVKNVFFKLTVLGLKLYSILVQLFEIQRNSRVKHYKQMIKILQKYKNMRQFQTNIYKDIAPLGTCLFHREIRPRDESFLQMVRYTFLPYFQPYTLAFFWLILICFTYIYSLTFHGTQDKNDEFLKVSQSGLFTLGQNSPYHELKNYNYYRLLTSFVLFRNFYHFLLTSIGVVCLASYIQKIVGFKRVFVLAISTGLAGQLFGNLFYSKVSLESLTPVIGFIGYLFAVLLVNRTRQWEYYANENRNMFFLLAFLYGLYLHLTLTYQNFSLFSNIFALIFGFIFYFCDPSYQIFCVNRYVVIIIISLGVAAIIFKFFFYTNPVRVQPYSI